jgi:hypothetical protein
VPGPTPAKDRKPAPRSDAQPTVDKPKPRRKTLADIPNPEPTKVPERRPVSKRVPGVDPAKLDPDLGPDPNLGIETPQTGEAERAAERPNPSRPAADPRPAAPPASGTEAEAEVEEPLAAPTLRVVEDLDPDAYEPDPTPFDIDAEADEQNEGPDPEPVDELDDDDDDDEFAGDFDPALAPPPGYRTPD